MGRIPIQLSPVINVYRQKDRIKATVGRADHLHGLPLPPGKEVLVEVKLPSTEPMLKMKLLFPLPNEPADPDLSDETILSIYCDGRSGRLVVPVRLIRDVALLPEEGMEERLAGAAVRPDSPLDYVAQYRAAHKPPPRTVYLVFLCDPGVPEGTDIVLACPHRPKQAQALREYFYETLRGAPCRQVPLAQLGLDGPGD